MTTFTVSALHNAGLDSADLFIASLHSASLLSLRSVNLLSLHNANLLSLHSAGLYSAGLFSVGIRIARQSQC